MIIPNRYYGKIPLWIREDGEYCDKDGTVFPALLWDENRPGLNKVWALRTDSPFMKMSLPHDKAFDRLRAGYKMPGENALSVSNRLLGNGARVMLDDGLKPVLGGIATILEGMVVIPLGYVIGAAMYYIKDKRN